MINPVEKFFTEENILPELPNCNVGGFTVTFNAEKKYFKIEDTYLKDYLDAYYVKVSFLYDYKDYAVFTCELNDFYTTVSFTTRMRFFGGTLKNFGCTSFPFQVMIPIERLIKATGKQWSEYGTMKHL